MDRAQAEDFLYHEARLLATMVADPKQLTWGQAEQWASDFDAWLGAPASESRDFLQPFPADNLSAD